MSPALPLFATHSAARDFAGYSDEVKADIKWKLSLLTPVMQAGRGQIGAAIAEIAVRQGVSVQTVRRWYDLARAGDLHGLANKWLDAKMQRRDKRTLLPADDIALFQRYCLANQRVVSAALKAMLRDWRAGKITTTQPIDPMSGRPVGWSPNNLRVHTPARYELAAMRQGRWAASSERPQVLTTRVGLRVGQYYVGDDAWHDHLVHWRGHNKPVRPLEASVLDLASAALVKWGHRPRRTRANGTRENLSEKEVRWIVAATMRDIGYRADELGTTWLVESGTFAIRDALAGPLHDHFGISVKSSSVLGDRAWQGAYGAKGGGNPRFKTWLESLHSLKHNEFGALPGQVGRNRDEKPEELAALTRYAEKVADAEERLALVAPTLAAALVKPVLTYSQFLDTCDQVYGFINTRRDHKLEGWRECGHEIVQYLFGPQLIDEATFLALPPPPGVDMHAWARSFAERGLTRTRLLSPAEVLTRGRGELTPLPAHGISLILGADLGREQRVEAGEFVWEDADLAVGELRYYAEITTPEGRRELLKTGETYLVHANPFALDELCVSDARGRFLGVAPRHHRANRADREAMEQQFRAVAAYEAQLQDELARKAAPLMHTRLAGMEANVGTLEAALHTRERATDARATARIDQTALIARRTEAAQQAAAEAPPAWL